MDKELKRPSFGAQVFIEPGQTQKEIDTWFGLLKEHAMDLCRIRMFEVYMHMPDDSWDFSLFDMAFKAAEKYSVQIWATLFPATSFTDVGGFKFPRSDEHLKSIAKYIHHLVSHFKTFSSLGGWVLMNEPGLGMPFRETEFPGDEFTTRKFEEWKKEHPQPKYTQQGYPALDLSRERFIVDYTIWFLTWLAGEIKKYDPGRHLHVNNHAIFQNVAEYRFTGWRDILDSLGGSAHASWHFGYFERSRYAAAMTADCEIVRSGAGRLPWLITEIQGGNNIYSGFEPMCPTKEEITQWLWTIVASGGKGGIFWCLNPRGSGYEAGEWAMIDFHDAPSDRLMAAGKVAHFVAAHGDFFEKAEPVESGINILYTREALWIEKRLKTQGTHYEGRGPGGVMKSALAYFEALGEMGIQANIKAIDEFDFSRDDNTGSMIILAHQVSLPSRYWKPLEHFVQTGGKLVVDGLTAYYDGHAHCIMKTGFPLTRLFGGSVREFILTGNLFYLPLTDPAITLQGHCWLGFIENKTGSVCGTWVPGNTHHIPGETITVEALPGKAAKTSTGEKITALRNSRGKGEVLWIPIPVGLGARISGYGPLCQFLYHEAAPFIEKTPIRFSGHQPGMLLRTLRTGDTYMTILINKSGEPSIVPLVVKEKLIPEIFFADKGGTITRGGHINIDPEETIVILWEQDRSG
jgi:beta-galactosidase